jgi:hypothetical protein
MCAKILYIEAWRHIQLHVDGTHVGMEWTLIAYSFIAIRKTCVCYNINLLLC